MAEQSKFAGALGRLNKQPAATVTDTEPEPRPEPHKGRQTGKRSNPDFSPTTFFVRKETKRKAAQLLLNEENSGKDLSDLVEQLLAEWVDKHSQA